MSEPTMKNNKVEVRVEIDSERVAVLDAFCQATGRHRTDIFIELLEKWSRDQEHVAMMILNVRNRNPIESEGHRT